MIYEPEDRAKRDDDEATDKPDLRAIHDCYREGLIDEDEARSMMGLGKRDDAPADDEPMDDEE